MNGIGNLKLNRPLLYSAFLIFLAVMLTFFAVTHTVSSLLLVPGNQVLDDLRKGEPLSAEQINSLISSRERSLKFSESGQKWTDIGLALLLQESLNQGPKEKREALESAITSLKNGLSQAPSNPWGWVRLAHAYILLEGPSEQAAEALIRAMVVAPYEPRLMFTRLSLVFATWESFPKNVWPLVFGQVRMAWRHSPENLVDLTIKTRRLQVVRSALLEDKNAFENFERLVGKSLSSQKK